MIRVEVKKIIGQSLDSLIRDKKIEKNFIDYGFWFEKPLEQYGDLTVNLHKIIERKKDKLGVLHEKGENFSKEEGDRILEKIKEHPDFKKFFTKAEFKAPVFFNFFYNSSYLQKQVLEILKKKEKFGQLKLGRNKKINLEFISANPTGPLTVGNSRGGPWGETLANVLTKAGFKVTTAYYVNDYGQQILALGHSVLKDNQAEYKGGYIEELRRKIKGKDPYQVGQKAAQSILETMIKKTIKKMGFHFDEWVYESHFHQTGLVDKIIQKLKKKNLLYEKDGAWWFKASQLGDNRDRVLIKQDGQKTYLAGDLAYHWYKFKIKKYHQAINIWGADHLGDEMGLRTGLRALGLKNKLTIIFLQFVTLWQKQAKLKMSKRAGTYVTLDELLSEMSRDVIKFFFLQKSANTHLNFDLDLAKEQSEKNPIYYIQYAHARICSIIRKSKNQISESEVNRKIKTIAQNLKLLVQPTELKLIKQLIKLPEIIEETAQDFQVQRLSQYAFDLATVFHQFYRDCKVLSETEGLREARLALILATKIVLKTTLDLMNINAPEKM
ncbi:MAG: arginine--tRNA ligase [Minisyncoccales bacterium]